MKISFFVPGRIAPGGSKSGFYRNGRVIVAPASKFTKPWMRSVYAAAKQAYSGRPIQRAVKLYLSFRMARPKSHWTKAGALSKSGRQRPYPTVKPDLTKVIRSTEDALTGVLWEDDCQVICQAASKEYGRFGEQSGVLITVETVDGNEFHEIKN